MTGNCDAVFELVIVVIALVVLAVDADIVVVIALMLLKSFLLLTSLFLQPLLSW